MKYSEIVLNKCLLPILILVRPNILQLLLQKVHLQAEEDNSNLNWFPLY